jgi:hypothetical protein
MDARWSAFDSSSLFQESRRVAITSGLEGHAPHCTFLSGTIPQGMVLERDCTVSGRPTTAGPYEFTFRLGAEGISNTRDLRGSGFVAAPEVRYQPVFAAQFVPVHFVVNSAPTIRGWIAPADLPVSWSYRLSAGVLPPGVSLDPASGLLQGTVASAGVFDAQIEATLTTSAGTYTPPAAALRWQAEEKTFHYDLFTASQQIAVGTPLFLGQSLFGSAITSGDSSLRNFRIVSGTLPPGIQLDPLFGGLGGQPSAPAPRSDVVIEASIVTGPTTNVYRVTLPLEVLTFATIAYPETITGQVGVPMEVPLTVRNQLDSEPVTAALNSVDPSCGLPPRVSIRQVDGTVLGTPSLPGVFDCTARFELTHGTFRWSDTARIHVVVD